MAQKKYTPEELMRMSIDESLKSIPEHKDKVDPKVGAIITTGDGEILATAHRGELRVGEHCEYTLIERKLKAQNLKDCVLYVTLEPCVDKVRKDPKKGCSTHIVKARIGTVYIGMRDPNPQIENEGVKFLLSKDINVIDFPAHLEDEIRKTNEKFIKEKELEQMQMKVKEAQMPLSYFQEAVPTSKISQFDTNAVQKFLHLSNAAFSYPSDDFNQWALGFELISKDNNESFSPTRLGLILFGKNLEDLYPHTIFKVEINYENGEQEIRDFGGAIVNQLVPIVDFIKDKALKITLDRSKGQREEKIDFPIDVLREAISNAIIHRDYENEKSTNYLSISPDKIIVRSPGSPEKPLTLEDLKTFDTPSVSRNPKIMFVFNKMKFAEQRGIGLKSMKKLNELGFPLPTFDLKAGMLEITFGRNKDFIAVSIGIDSKLLSQEDNEGLLFIQKNEPISVKDYAINFGLTDKTAQRRITRLYQIGLLEREGENRWIKYRIKK